MMLAQILSRSAWILVALAASASAAAAQDASAWNGDARSAARLVAGQRQDGKSGSMLRAAIEIRLAPGWKTYWRYPGDSGVPPQFDFSSSQNVQKVDVLWPAPRRFTDEEGSTIGYDTDLLLPLHIVPGSGPVTLRLKVDYAICEKLCVPAQATATLNVSGAPTPFDPALAQAEARVPVPTPLGAPGPLAIKAVQVTPAAMPQVQVDVAASPGAPVDLFAEGPTPDWALPLPRLVPGAPADMRRFVFDIDGVPPGASADGATLRLTATAGDKAIETLVPLPRKGEAAAAAAAVAAKP